MGCCSYIFIVSACECVICMAISETVGKTVIYCYTAVFINTNFFI